MKKVLSIVLNNFTHDSRVLKECVSLHKAGYDVAVLALHDDSEGLLEHDLISGIPVHRVRLVSKSWPRIPIIQGVKFLEFIIRAQSSCRNADILHCNDLNALIVGVVAKIMTLGRLKIVYDAHELECEAYSGRFKKVMEAIERRGVSLVNSVITVSPSIADDYVRRYKIDKPKLVLNAPHWKEKHQEDVFRDIYDISIDQRIFLYQGGLTFDRGIKELVTAFSARKKKDVALVFMGYGEAEKYLQEAMRKYPNIFLHPAVSPNDILRYTCGADYGLVVLHKTNNSIYYCLPNKFFEYATCGLPVLANDLLEVSRWIDKYNMGTVIEMMSSDSINLGIDYLLNSDYQKLSENARKMAKENSWEEQEQVLLSVYRKLENIRGDF